MISYIPETTIGEKTISVWESEYPIVKRIRSLEETAWINDSKLLAADAKASCELTIDDVLDAKQRLERFSEYLKIAFPETASDGGILESPVRPVPAMQQSLETEHSCRIPGRMLVKLDSHLPISGSIKARGGIYEVLNTAERIAAENDMLSPGDSYAVFASPEFRNLFSRYSISVGSTGNLGLSIGIMSAALGFHTAVHMSSDARQWKKDMLRSKGVEVIEYASDYSIAVAEGRKQAQGNPLCHFVDDENSKTLFLGYAVAALRLKKQLAEAGVAVDADHPLFVYLPCGVGGGPGGVAFGLKLVFGDHAHCFFAEPTHSCCMMLGMATGLYDSVSVQDLGLDNQTIADGLAVGRASSFVGRVMTPFMSGCYSLSDKRMLHMLAQFYETEKIYLEPSALAGMYGPVLLSKDPVLGRYMDAAGIPGRARENSTHLIWATGGSMVPQSEQNRDFLAGKNA